MGRTRKNMIQLKQSAGEAAALTGLPSVTIGGVLPDDLPVLRDSGLAGVAVVSGICAAPDPGVAARAYLDRIESLPPTEAARLIRQQHEHAAAERAAAEKARREAQARSITPSRPAPEHGHGRSL